jgi:hypothetical protein
MRFWLAWVHGEIDRAVERWLRRQARHDPALEQDLASLDPPGAFVAVGNALEATNYLTPASGQLPAGPPPLPAAAPASLEELTDLVLQQRLDGEAPGLRGLERGVRGAACQVHPQAESLRYLADTELLAAFVAGESAALTELQRRHHQALVEQVLPWLPANPARSAAADTLVQAFWDSLAMAPGALGACRVGPRVAVGKILAQELRAFCRKTVPSHLGDPATSPSVRDRPAADRLSREERPLHSPYSYRVGPSPARRSLRKLRDKPPDTLARIGRSLFRLLEEVEVSLPPREETTEATRLLQYLVGDEAIRRFQELHHWLSSTRERMALAGGPPFFVALDRLLLWLAPDCFLTTEQGPAHELSFRLYLRSRLKHYCRSKGLQPAGLRYPDLETAFRALDRDRMGEVVRDAVQQAAHADWPLSPGVASLQALQWLEAAP